MKNVTLYGYANSPYVRKTACFLYFKGIEFSHVPVDPIQPEPTIGFTQGSRVPVLKIDDEWKLESSDHAYWLDDVFPDKPLCPVDHKNKIQEIDDWISNTYLTSLFRLPIDGKMDSKLRYSAWRLAALISAHTPLPEKIRNLWPQVLRQAPFIQDMADHMDLSESHEDMDSRIVSELASHIGEGPYIGGFQQPTMLDLAIYPNVLWFYMFGVMDELKVRENPIIMNWIDRVSKHLPENPCLTPDHMIVHSLKDCLT